MRNKVIDNLRGLCLLGVLGIHVGSIAGNGCNFWLYTLLEVLSRYSIPAFFFISGYGLFCGDKELLALARGEETDGEGLAYLSFLKKRLRSSALPYVSWSLFYEYYFWLPVTTISWLVWNQPFVLFYGLASYHLYFMVILIVFYFTQPIWRSLMKLMLKTSVLGCMSVLLILQLALYYWSSHPNIQPENLAPWLRNMYLYRLNYIPLYYLVVYIFGGLCALYWDKLKEFMLRKWGLVIAFYLMSLVYIEGSAYYSFNYRQYDLLSLAYTYHQLSPQGLAYTIGSIGFFCCVLLQYEEGRQNEASGTGEKIKAFFYKALELLSHYSMLIYFVHPLILDLMNKYYVGHGIVLTNKKICFTFVMLLFLSLLASIFIEKICSRVKVLRLLIMGK